MPSVFIDGQAGTTGLQITERLQARGDLTLVTLDDTQRKDPAARQAALTSADVAILCLPDDAAREAVELAAGRTRVIDASTAHRVHADWTYGLPELTAGQRARIAAATCVSNPGCYPQGFVLLVRPLIDAGLLSAETALRCNAVSGYSGGGRKMIEAHQAFGPADRERNNSQLYGLDLAHKHVPEMQAYSGCSTAPLFAPMVANFYNGMLVQVPLFATELGGAGPDRVRAVLADAYADEPFIDVLAAAPADAADGYLNATACNGSNRMELMVFGNAQQVLLVARFDNLGKGAAGAAVQNLNLMLGLDEHLGLEDSSTAKDQTSQATG